jgi:outer membrane PBP1 activator LpoA protein
MKAREQVAALLKEWLGLTHLECHSIQLGRWASVARVQKNKSALQQPLIDALARWRIENPDEAGCNPFRKEIGRLLELESHNSELLAVRKREVREKMLLLEQALYDLRRIRSDFSKAA